MENIIFNRIQESDIVELTKISIKAFHTDYLVGSPNTKSGPPGYDSNQFYRKMMKVSKAFYKMLLNQKIIGAFFIFDKGRSHYYLGRIFIDPEYHRKGYGTQSMDFLFHTYKDIIKWSLETPPWNIRTKQFYLKLGFKIVNETQKDTFFERNM
jgi:RimJ/RimL family protein N-acetyltransferase